MRHWRLSFCFRRGIDLLAGCLLLLSSQLLAASLHFEGKDAEVWRSTQHVFVQLKDVDLGAADGHVEVFRNGERVRTFVPVQDRFRVELNLKPGENRFQLCVGKAQRTCSENLRLKLRLQDRQIEADPPQGFDRQPSYLKRPSWMKTAVIYSVAPRMYSNGEKGTLTDVTGRLEEIKELGANVLWIQPINPSRLGDQGYDILDFFEVDPELGSKEDLKILVDRAHELGLKVLLDFVPNHVAFAHRYAKDAIKFKTRSHYWNFFHHEKSKSPYQFHQKLIQKEGAPFMVYFWDDLASLNFSNPEVQNWLISAALFWVREFNVDGYRVDTAWAIQAEHPEFFKKLRYHLRRIKPDAFLMGELKAGGSPLFEKNEISLGYDAFDAAYDWTRDDEYISEWRWQFGELGQTFFNNLPQHERSYFLADALTNGGRGYLDNSRILRFIENNDVPRFLSRHSAGQKRMAAALLLTLPGLPMLYYGQALGMTEFFPSFDTHRKLKSYDTGNWWEFYQELISLRKRHPALHSKNFTLLKGRSSLEGCGIVFRRWSDNAAGLAVFANLCKDKIRLEAESISESVFLEPYELKIKKIKSLSP